MFFISPPPGSSKQRHIFTKVSKPDQTRGPLCVYKGGKSTTPFSLRILKKNRQLTQLLLPLRPPTTSTTSTSKQVSHKFHGTHRHLSAADMCTERDTLWSRCGHITHTVVPCTYSLRSRNPGRDCPEYWFRLVHQPGFCPACLARRRWRWLCGLV